MKSNADIAKALNEMAIFYAMDDVAFKPVAYEEAANAVDGSAESVAELYKRGGLKALKKLDGVGPSIAQHIEALIEHGDFREHARFLRKYPVDVVGMCGIEGVGPKTVKLLYQKLGIRTMLQLENAARKGKLRGVSRLGEKTEASILRGIARVKSSSGRHLLGDVLDIARDFEMRIGEISGVIHAAVAGSVRRRQETVGDFDVVVTTKDHMRAMEAIGKMHEVAKVLEHGDTKLVVRLHNGMNADIRVVDPMSYGATLQYFTGDKAHNIEVRKLATKKGLMLNEYGLWRGKKLVAARSEEDVYKALGLRWMAPELRTNTGEIEAARQRGRDGLPKLIGYDHLRGDLQVQTDWTDGSASIREMAEAARDAGLEYIAITDHTKSLAMVGGLDEKGLMRQAREIARVNREMRGFHVLSGAEVNVMRDGSLDVQDAALAKLDVVGVSVHSFFGLSRKEQTERVVRAMRNPHVDVVFHPTGRLIGRRDPIDLDMDVVIAMARETRTALEVNGSPDRLDLRDVFVRKAVEAGVKLVINSDAHAPEHFRFLELGLAQARRGWTEKTDVVNTKGYRDLKEWLTTPKAKRR